MTSPQYLVISDELFEGDTKSSQASRAVLNTIFHRFCITNDYKHNQLFLSNLEYILRIGQTHNAHILWDKAGDFDLEHTWVSWHKTTADALEQYKTLYGATPDDRLPFTPTGSKRADCLIQNLNNPTENQIGLTLLYVAFLMLPPQRTEPFNLDKITQSFMNAHSLSAVFPYLPLDYRNSNKEEFLDKLSDACQKIVLKQRYGEKITYLLRRIDDLSSLLQTGKHKHKGSSQQQPARRENKKSKPLSSKRASVRFTKFHDQAQSVTDFGGKVEVIVSDPSEEAILGILDTANNETEKINIPKVTRDAELKVGSKYWLQNFSESIPWNQNGVNPMTLKMLTDWVKENDSYESLMFCLMLAVGNKIPQLMNMTVGTNGVLTSDGYLIRKYIPPENHYQPGEDVKDILIATEETFAIELPEVAKRLLKMHVHIDTESTSLSMALDVTTDKAEKDVSRVIKKLIKNGAVGLARDRIHMILRKQISMMCGDEFIAYVITGSNNEAPPVSAYYSRLPTSYFQKIYNEAINEIFQ